MENKSSKWRKQDYFWLIGILIGIIVFICAIRLSDNADIVNIFSFIASGVSIALAFIAIWWGQVNNSEANKIYDKINEKLDNVKGETDALNQMMEQMQSDLSQKLYKGVDSLSNVSDEVKEEIKNVVNDSIELINIPSYSNEKSRLICAQMVYDNLIKYKSNEEKIIFETTAKDLNYGIDIVVESAEYTIAINVKKLTYLQTPRKISNAMPEIVSKGKTAINVIIIFADEQCLIGAGYSDRNKYSYLSLDDVLKIDIKKHILSLIK